ncbi:MAG: hypothetical protein V1901_02280 [Patescibacteria group bacterium]
MLINNFKLIKKFKLDLIDIIVLAFYYIFTCFLFLGLFGFFNRFFVSLVLFLLLLALFFLRNSISFSKKYLLFFLIVPIVTAGFGFLRGFFVGDAYVLWLPAARDIAQFGSFPGISDSYFFSRMPLFPLLIAGTFSLFNSFNEFLGLWIPFFFTSATLVVIYQWAKEKDLNKKFLFFIPVLFLTNIIVEFYGGWNLLQESLILFFATTFFYYYEKYLSNGKKKNLVFLILSFVLVCASKISGLFLLILIPWLFFKTKDKKRFFSYLFLFSMPIIFWLVRNYLIFDNPFFHAFNSIFKGKYYQVVQQHSVFHTLPEYLTSFWNQVWWVFSNYFWMSYPFIILSFYGFVKKRRYDFLFLIISFFIIKESFLFTVTDSSVRYYYLFLGLFLVYALLGLQEIKSKWLISLLIVSALVGLFLIPVTDSTSQFISLFENKLIFLEKIFNFLHNYWYLVAIILFPFIYRVSEKKDIKIFLIFLYSFFILHLRFVVNKSWLNTWPFISLALVFLLVFIFKQRIKYFKQIVIGLIILVIFTNSWLMASIYYWNQGEVNLPVSYIWENSKLAEESLNRLIGSEKRSDFYIITAIQDEYFLWWTNYQVIRLFNLSFFFKFKEYRNDMSNIELKKMFENYKVKYLIKNADSYDSFANEYVDFFERIENSDLFSLISEENNKYSIWQVY